MSHNTINPLWCDKDQLTKCKGWFDFRWADIIYLRDPNFDKHVMRLKGKEYVVDYCPFCGVKIDE